MKGRGGLLYTLGFALFLCDWKGPLMWLLKLQSNEAKKTVIFSTLSEFLSLDISIVRKTSKYYHKAAKKLLSIPRIQKIEGRPVAVFVFYWPHLQIYSTQIRVS